MSFPDTDSIRNIKEFKFDIENVTFESFFAPMHKRSRYVKPYSHSFYVVCFCYGGSFHIKLENNDIVLSEGDAILISPGTMHLPQIDSPDVLAGSISFNFEKNAFLTSNDLFTHIEKIFSAPYILLKEEKTFYENIFSLYKSFEKGNIFSVAEAFYRFIVTLIENFDISKSSEIFNSLISDTDMSRINKINTIANVHYEKNITIEELSDILHLSTRQTDRIIHNHFGCSWRELVLLKRMKIALDLLQSTKMSVWEISEYVGYSSLRGFYTAFKKYYKKLPGDFR